MAQNLYDLLGEAELQQYYQKLRDELKVTSVPQLKYVEEEDLAGIGMTKPEQRRLKKFFKKAYPQGAFGKIKKILSKSPGDGIPPPQSPPVGRAQPQPKPGSRHIIPEESIILQKTLGGGEFGTVQQGLWTNEEGERLQVAIKCLSKEHMHSGMADFLKEATIMHSIDHDHIVRLYGVVLGSENLMLVTELAPLRSLLECLKEPALRASFPVMQLCDFAIQIADGMTYLENKRMIHRDLAARNILVFARDQIKVSDFGLSRALGVGSDYYQTNFNVNLKLPIAWCAPECINYLKFTSASDVWAYGVTLWEIFSYGFQPWAAFTGQQILEAIDEPTCQRLEQPEFCPCDYYEIMLKCWDHDPDARPTFSNVLHMLPQAKPEQVQAVRECPPDGTQDALTFKTGEVITVLDNTPDGAPVDGMWKGVLENGRTGFFYPGDTTPYIEIKTISPATRPKKVTRRESARKSQKPIMRQKIKADMISKPQNDLRHTGHIGYDGAVFGDVSFIGDNYDKLPVKVVAPYQPQNDLQGSSGSLPRDTDVEKGFDVFSKSPGGITSSQLSLRSDFSSVGDTLTDVSSMPADTSGSASSKGVGGFDDFEIPSSGLDDFKMPDLSSDLDFGSSLMDDIMKAFDSKKDDSETETGDKETDHAPSDATKDRWELDEETPEQQNPSDTQDKSFIPSSDRDVQFSTSLASPEVLTPLSSSDNSSFCASGYTTHTTAMTYSAEPASPSPPPVSRKPERFVRRQDVDEDDIINGISALSVTGQSPQSTGRQDFHFEQSMERESTEASGLSSRETSPEKESDGRKKSRLKLPLHGSTPRTKKEAKVKPMSSSDEKTLEEAIALVEEFTQYNTKESMLHSPISVTHGREMSPESEGSSPKLFKGFSFGKSPKQDHKSFSDELSSVSDLSEDLTPESQDAYNELVMRGSFKEKEKGPAGVRERRMRRSMEHQKNYAESEGIGKNGRPVNMNIREPQGIPVRRPSTQTEEETEVDVNPLRRLRDSKAAVTPRARAPRIPLDTGSKFGGASRFSAQRYCSSNLNGTDDAEPSVGGGLSPKQTHSQQILVDESCNPLPLPPKHFPKPLITERPLRERKYPLNIKSNVNPRLASEKSPSDSHQSPAPSPSSSLANSSDNVFDFSSQEELKSPPHIAPKPQNEKPQYTLTHTSDSYHTHRLNNNNDSFWTQKMKSYELIDEEAVDSGACDGLVSDPDQLNISDSISYEEQLELALDGPQERNEEFNEEVHQMKSALTLEVEEECRQTLNQEDTKLVKLRQLVSQGLGDVNSCKQALVCSGWDLTAAASYLIAHPPDQASPECIDV